MTKKKAAFTLAEVLITLGIIGIVAALTLPSLTAKYQKKQTVVHLKKVYSLLAQSAALSKIDNGEDWDISPGDNENTLNLIDKFIRPYLKITKVCLTTNNECYPDNYMQLNGNRLSEVGEGRVIIILAGGEVISLYPNLGSFNMKVDINGKKKPNTMGKDIFEFVYSANGSYPSYYENTREDCLLNYLYGCNKNASGAFCGAVIMKDGWEIRDDYPW